MVDATLRVLADEPIGTISPRLYGHFAEHLGRCCYDGLWAGRGSEIENEGGFRTDVLDALRAMPTPLLRWPGGCYADHYHWRDGIGPDRPRRLGMSCGAQVDDDNALGTHEFLELCARIGAEPYLAGNVGSGTPQEMADWVEYVNSSRDTTLTRERRANGRGEPWNVRLWGVGNENWGCGGHYDARSYGLEYRRYATMIGDVDPTIERVICGHEEAWNIELMHTLRDHLWLGKHLSIHRYWSHGGPGEAFGEEEYYALLAEAERTEEFVVRTREIVEEVNGGRYAIGLALDEWGVWHPEARTWGPGAVNDPHHEFEQANTLRDALAAAVALEGFHRQCQSLSMANLAQVVNVLHAPIRTEGAQMWLTPTYHVFRLHLPHVGSTAVRAAIESDTALPDGSPAVSGTASLREEGAAVTLVNRHYSRESLVRLQASGVRAEGAVLTAEGPQASNGPDAPERVAVRPLDVRRSGGEVELRLPPHSVATVLL